MYKPNQFFVLILAIAFGGGVAGSPLEYLQSLEPQRIRHLDIRQFYVVDNPEDRVQWLITELQQNMQLANDAKSRSVALYMLAHASDPDGHPLHVSDEQYRIVLDEISHPDNESIWLPVISRMSTYPDQFNERIQTILLELSRRGTAQHTLAAISTLSFRSSFGQAWVSRLRKLAIDPAGEVSMRDIPDFMASDLLHQLRISSATAYGRNAPVSEVLEFVQDGAIDNSAVKVVALSICAPCPQKHAVLDSDLKLRREWLSALTRLSSKEGASQVITSHVLPTYLALHLSDRELRTDVEADLRKLEQVWARQSEQLSQAIRALRQFISVTDYDRDVDSTASS